MKSDYTVLTDPRVDAFIQAHLDSIVASLRDLLGKDLVAVLLAGGFGRGEGSVLVNKDGTMHVVNDYDLEVVFREPLAPFPSKLLAHLRYGSRLDKLARQLADEFAMKQVDLAFQGYSTYLNKNLPKLADYDLKYGSKLLFGTQNPVDDMPAYQPREIPAFEGTWLLRNRGIGLLLARLYFDGETLKKSKEEYFNIEINKAFLAMGDALFIIAGEYECSYSIRSEKIDLFSTCGFSDIEELICFYKQAARYKLKPQTNMYPGTNPKELWNTANRLFQSFFLFFEAKRLGKSFPNLNTYAEWALGLTSLGVKQKLKIIYYKYFRGNKTSPTGLLRLKLDQVRSILYTIALLACADNNENAPAAILNAIYDGALPQLSQKNWANAVVTYLLTIHPGGEVGRFLQPMDGGKSS